MARTLEAEIVLQGKDRSGKAFASASKGFSKLSTGFRRFADPSGGPRVARTFDAIGRSLSGVNRFGSGALRTLTAISGIGAGVGLASLSLSLKTSADAIDDMSKSARLVGVPLQQFRAFAHVAELAGMNSESFGTSLITAARNFALIEKGALRGAKRIEALSPGLVGRIKEAKDAGAAINEMLGALHNASNPATRIALSELLFGSEDMAKVAEIGPAQMKQALTQATRLLGTITEDQGKAIEDFNDSVTDLGTAFNGLRHKLAVDLLPKLQPLVESVTDWTVQNRAWISENVGEAIRDVKEAFKDVDWQAVAGGVTTLGNAAVKTAELMLKAFAGLDFVFNGLPELARGWRHLIPGLTTVRPRDPNASGYVQPEEGLPVIPGAGPGAGGGQWRRNDPSELPNANSSAPDVQRSPLDQLQRPAHTSELESRLGVLTQELAELQRYLAEGRQRRRAEALERQRALQAEIDALTARISGTGAEAPVTPNRLTRATVQSFSDLTSSIDLLRVSIDRLGHGDGGGSGGGYGSGAGGGRGGAARGGGPSGGGASVGEPAGRDGLPGFMFRSEQADNWTRMLGGGAEAGGRREGGSRSWRNNNPGNLRYSAATQAMGATGRDEKGFAIFPDEATGESALQSLLFTDPRYAGLSISEAMNKYAPPVENDTGTYVARLTKAMGVSADTQLSALSSAQRQAMLAAIRKHEGWKPGTMEEGAPVSAGGLSDQVRRGSANFMNGQFGAPGENLTTITSPSGEKWTVNEAAAPYFRGFIEELESRGYKARSSGGYNNRSIRGSSRKSQHAYGNAIDINAASNQLGSQSTDMPADISDLAAKYGLSWGGDWKKRPDPMHFEWTGATGENRAAGSALPAEMFQAEPFGEVPPDTRVGFGKSRSRATPGGIGADAGAAITPELFQSETMGGGRFELGRGQIDVTLKAEPGTQVSGMKSQGSPNVQLNTGIDMTGRRAWRPGMAVGGV